MLLTVYTILFVAILVKEWNVFLDACDVLGNFMARAIADDCIPPKFLSSYKGHVEIEEAKNALQVSNNDQ